MSANRVVKVLLYIYLADFHSRFLVFMILAVFSACVTCKVRKICEKDIIFLDIVIGSKARTEHVEGIFLQEDGLYLMYSSGSHLN